MVSHYIKVRKAVFTTQNIKSGWRGAALFPKNLVKVYDRVQLASTPPLSTSTQSSSLFEDSCITGSPVDPNTLR